MLNTIFVFYKPKFQTQFMSNNMFISPLLTINIKFKSCIGFELETFVPNPYHYILGQNQKLTKYLMR